ncbi:GIY-YIG nuclease family protein [Halomonas denitrificans]|uniref:GIY-YIG nuclease family protein n=1 Tax=Halomonas denitrificans TaxID=370769 RepID=UPI000D35DC51|nr:GIY-YIG nuclease family protein [Halomonas denitrificans]
MNESITPEKSGHVYIMTNHAMKNMVKIGMTKGSPEQRARDISGTGVPGYWCVNYKLWVMDCRWVEWSTHRYFSELRVDKSREFFRVDPKVAQVVIKHFADSLLDLMTSTKGAQDHAGSEENRQPFSPDIDWYVYPEREEVDPKAEAERHRKLFEYEKNEELRELRREEERKARLQREREDFERREKSRLDGFKVVKTIMQQCDRCNRDFTVTLMRHEQGARCPFCNQFSPTQVSW